MSGDIAIQRWQGSRESLVRLILATILCAPLAGAGLTILVTGGLGVFVAPGFVLYGAAYGILFGHPAMLIFGLPAHSFLYRHKLRTARWYVLAGLPAGLLTFAAHVISVEAFGAGFVGLQWWNVLYFSVFHFAAATLAAGLFWFIRRPDRDAALTPPTSPQTSPP